MSRTVMVDGEVVNNALARDRALHYGDGLFETMASRNGRVRQWDRHMRRLERGCRALGIEAPQEALLREQFDALDASGDSVVKLIVTRGDGRRGYAPEPGAPVRIVWQVSPWPSIDPQLYAAGARVAWLDTSLARQPALAGIKHLNRLEQVLAARELAGLDADEGLLCDTRGEVIEAVSANVFMVRDGVLATPTLAHCGVAGVTREAVLEAARELGMETAVTTLRRADFAFADEVFLTSSVRALMSVTRLGDVVYTQRHTGDALRAFLSGGDDG